MNDNRKSNAGRKRIVQTEVLEANTLIRLWGNSQTVIIVPRELFKSVHFPFAVGEELIVSITKEGLFVRSKSAQEILDEISGGSK